MQYSIASGVTCVLYCISSIRPTRRPDPSRIDQNFVYIFVYVRKRAQIFSDFLKHRYS